MIKINLDEFVKTPQKINIKNKDIIELFYKKENEYNGKIYFEKRILKVVPFDAENDFIAGVFCRTCVFSKLYIKSTISSNYYTDHNVSLQNIGLNKNFCKKYLCKDHSLYFKTIKEDWSEYYSSSNYPDQKYVIFRKEQKYLEEKAQRIIIYIFCILVFSLIGFKVFSRYY